MTLSVSEELEQLREENRQLRGVLGSGMRWPAEWRLSRTETLILGSLVARESVSYDQLMTILYSDRIEPPHDSIIYNFMTLLRRRIRKIPPICRVVIRTLRGSGYYIAVEDRKMLRELTIK